MSEFNYQYDDYKQSIEFWRERLRFSEEARRHHSGIRTSFFDKMIVLSSGTIAVIVSLVSSSSQSRLGSTLFQVFPRGILVAALSMVAISLLLAVVHNRVEIKAIAHDYRAAELSERAAAIRVATSMNQHPAYIADYDKLSKEKDEWSQAAKAVRDRVDKIGFCAVLSLTGGYIALFVWIVILLFKF